MKTREETELEALCRELGIQCDAYPGLAEETNGDMPNNWKVHLKYKGRHLWVDFFGEAAVKSISGGDVVSTLVSDVLMHENNEYSKLFTDASTAIKVYQKMLALAPRVRAFLGEHLEALSQAEH